MIVGSKVARFALDLQDIIIAVETAATEPSPFAKLTVKLINI